MCAFAAVHFVTNIKTVSDAVASCIQRDMNG